MHALSTIPFVLPSVTEIDTSVVFQLCVKLTAVEGVESRHIWRKMRRYRIAVSLPA